MDDIRVEHDLKWERSIKEKLGALHTIPEALLLMNEYYGQGEMQKILDRKRCAEAKVCWTLLFSKYSNSRNFYHLLLSPSCQIIALYILGRKRDAWIVSTNFYGPVT